jgi:hypothetical protein
MFKRAVPVLILAIVLIRVTFDVNDRLALEAAAAACV